MTTNGALGPLANHVGVRLVDWALSWLSKPRSDPQQSADAIYEREMARLTQLERIAASPQAAHVTLLAPMSEEATLDLPTTAETIEVLKKRLASELYQLQHDLLDGGRIAGKPCDCLVKHTELGLLPMAKELAGMTNEPVGHDIIAWAHQNLPRMTPQVIAGGEWDEWYRKEAVLQVREFRKRLLGTESASEVVPTGVWRKANDLAARIQTGEMTREQAVAALKEELKA